MPIKWFTGFNGAATVYDTGFRARSGSLTTFSTGPTTNYLGRLVGWIDDNSPDSPTFRSFHRKYNETSIGGYAQGLVKEAPWDATKKALVINLTKNSSTAADFYLGIAMQPRGSLIGKDYRVGFRVYAYPVSDAITYSLAFSNIAPAPINYYNRNVWASADVAKPIYVEIEWINSTKTVNVIFDGTLVISKVLPESSGLGGGLAIYTETYSNATATFSDKPYLAFSDFYWQTIESAADVALGPGTVVAQATPVSDDVVQFSRSNPAYGSNAEIVNQPAGGDVAGNIVPYTGGRWVIGDAPGQQDLYNLNISDVTNRLSGVEAVSIRTVANNPGTVPMSFCAIAKSGSVQVESPSNVSVIPGDPSHHARSFVLEADPSDGSRWDTTKLARLKIGTKLIS